MEKYVVVGNCNGETVYWNEDRKGWYIHQYDATVYDDVEKANTASEIAEVTLTVECIENITFKKIN